MVATVRLINSGLLDELPALKIQVSHFAGGIGRYLPRIRGLQQPGRVGRRTIPRHGRQPRKPFDHYLQDRLFYDCAGWSGPDYAAERGAEWVRIGMAELPVSQLVFATDYPQAVRDDEVHQPYVDAVAPSAPRRALTAEARKSSFRTCVIEHVAPDRVGGQIFDLQRRLTDFTRSRCRRTKWLFL